MWCLCQSDVHKSLRSICNRQDQFLCGYSGFIFETVCGKPGLGLTDILVQYVFGQTYTYLTVQCAAIPETMTPYFFAQNTPPEWAAYVHAKRICELFSFL